MANAGGVINVYSELAGWTRERALRKADEIYDTVLGVFEIAKEQGIPTYVAADRLAERRMAAWRAGADVAAVAEQVLTDGDGDVRALRSGSLTQVQSRWRIRIAQVTSPSASDRRCLNAFPSPPTTPASS